MPKLIYSINAAGSPLEIATQALTVVQVEECAQRKGLTVEELAEPGHRRFLLVIPKSASSSGLLLAIHPLQP